MNKTVLVRVCVLLVLVACSVPPLPTPILLPPTPTDLGPAVTTQLVPTATQPPTQAPGFTDAPNATPTATLTEPPTGTPTETPTSLPTLTPMPGASCDPSYVSPFGITMYAHVDDGQGLPQMAQAGSRWVTTYFRWSAIEPDPPVNGQPNRNWQYFDEQALAAQAVGMELFVLFADNPSWAAAYSGGPVTNTVDLLNFVTAAVERYDGDGLDDAPGRPVINYWSFYAEPDNETLWYAQLGKGYWGSNGAGYAQLLTELTPAIHAANPNAKVLIGGLAYDNFIAQGGPFNPNFLADVLAALSTYPGGVTAYLDALAFHFYPINADRWLTIRDKARAIRADLERYGAGSLPLIVPEMGFWSDTAVGSSEGWQAEYMAQMFTTGLAAGIQQLSWFDVFDNGTGSEMHGLFRGRDLTQPKPAYVAYTTLTTELEGGHYLRDLDVPDITGYVFSTCDTPEKLVVWGHTPTSRVSVDQSCVRRVNVLGEVAQITDGSANDLDGAANGQVVVLVTQHDMYYLGQCR